MPNYECWSDEHVPLDSEIIVVPDYTCNKPNDTMYLQKYTKLRKLIVGDYSYKYLEVVDLKKMYELESVEIGVHSFWVSGTYHEYASLQFYMEDCPRVTTLTIGDYSLVEYNTFVVKNCSSLVYIETGLSTAMSSDYVLFENLPVLKSMLFGYWSFACTHNLSRSVTFRNLPALESIVAMNAHNLDAGSFYYTTQLIVEGLPRLDQLDLHSKSFIHVTVWRTDCNVGAFLPYFEDQCSGTTWHFLVDGSAAPTGWNTLDAAPVAWRTAKEGFVPAAQGITGYYYSTFDGSTVGDAALLDVVVRVQAGAVVYLNGQEIRRVNLPAGELTADTLATAQFASARDVATSVPVAGGLLRSDENILAVETHRFDAVAVIDEGEEANAFNATTRAVAHGSNLLVDGAGSCSHTPYKNNPLANLFDGDAGTKTKVLDRAGQDVVVTWTYNDDRRVAVNKYGVVSGNNCNASHPSGWRLLGSNDGSEWDVLDTRSGVYFSVFKEEKSFLIDNVTAYNMYRLVFSEFNNPAFPRDSTGCTDKAFQLADIILSCN